jgi:hypothetical protein
VELLVVAIAAAVSVLGAATSVVALVSAVRSERRAGEVLDEAELLVVEARELTDKLTPQRVVTPGL